MLTIPKIAKALDVHSNTVRRDIYERFPEFFKPEKIKGLDKFDENESIKTLNKIKSLRDNGINKEDIKKTLIDSGFVVYKRNGNSNNNQATINIKIDIGPIEFGTKTIQALKEIAEVRKRWHLHDLN